MATVSPVSFGVTIPKYAPKASQQNSSNASNAPIATKSAHAETGAIPNQKSAIVVLLTSAALCTVAIANLIKAGR